MFILNAWWCSFLLLVNKLKTIKKLLNLETSKYSNKNLEMALLCGIEINNGDIFYLFIYHKWVSL